MFEYRSQTRARRAICKGTLNSAEVLTGVCGTRHLCVAISATPVGGHHIQSPPAFIRRGACHLGVKVAVLIDGGHLRVLAAKAKLHYENDLIEKVAHGSVHGDETLIRVLYYDCAPYKGTVRLPVSGDERVFDGNDGWVRNLSTRDYFAFRRGELKFRGFKPRSIPVAGRALTDDDFKPDFEQKGVDMRIGLDMATFSERRSVDRVILLTGDTDCIPAMKHARKAGLQVALVNMPDHKLSADLLSHADFLRAVGWPADAKALRQQNGGGA